MAKYNHPLKAQRSLVGSKSSVSKNTLIEPPVRLYGQVRTTGVVEIGKGTVFPA